MMRLRRGSAQESAGSGPSGIAKAGGIFYGVVGVTMESSVLELWNHAHNQ
jgi:hypothetical protein